MNFPQEIIENVIKSLGDDDKRSLKRCTLVSSSFLLPSRKQLFSRLSLDNDQTCQEIHKFLVKYPLIQSSVSSISLKHTSKPEAGHCNWQWMNGTSLLAIFRLPLRRLESFSIAVDRASWMNWNWNTFSSEMKDELLNIIHSSTLKTLSLTGLTEVPISFFFQIVHLTTLELHSLVPEDFDGENSSLLIQAASKGMAPVDSNAVIDRCVWRFEAHQIKISELTFLPFLCHLRFLEINIIIESAYINDFDILTILMDSLCISFDGTLEHLVLNIRHFDDDNDLVHPSYENLRDTWAHLDSITTHPTGLLRLQRVDININYSFRFELYASGDNEGLEFYEDELLKSVLDGLPLLRTKGILFVKADMAEDSDYESDDS